MNSKLSLISEKSFTAKSNEPFMDVIRKCLMNSIQECIQKRIYKHLIGLTGKIYVPRDTIFSHIVQKKLTSPESFQRKNVTISTF